MDRSQHIVDMSQYSSCTLCPRRCGVDRVHGKKGACAQGSTMRVARASLHMWEEPPISGSVGSGTIFFTGCPLGCIYCQNAAISKAKCEAGQDIDENDLAQIMLRLQGDGAMNINFVTPTHFAPSIRCSVAIARDRGLNIPTVWNTSGYELKNSIVENAPYVDIYLNDFKYFSKKTACDYSNASDYFKNALDALNAMVMCTSPIKFDNYRGDKRLIGGVIVRHMVIPGHIDESKRILNMLYSEFGDDILYSIMNQYTPILASSAVSGNRQAKVLLEKYPNLSASLSTDDYESVLDYADAIGIKDYFWQDGSSCAESFIPGFASGDAGNIL